MARFFGKKPAMRLRFASKTDFFAALSAEETHMKKLAKRIAALAMTAAMMTASAGAITQDGQSETWFDGVWALIDAFGLKAEHDPYVLQNYINKYLEKHPDEMYDVLNDILSLLDTHSMYLSSEEYSQGFSTLEGFVGIGVGLQETENGVQIAEVMRYSAAEEAGLQIGDLIVKINGEDATKLKNADVASKLRGEEGTSVKLTVRRYGRDITVTCERRQVNRVYVSNKTMADGVEYIKVSAIGSQNDWSAFSEIWDSLPSKNTRAVILDLRGNGGG
ncbi:PDZ domain-containing protein [Butyricicoccus sp. OF10-2]|nr:PDZ domain-containing protein [Butyricicoccus sp. OF10-2]